MEEKGKKGGGGETMNLLCVCVCGIDEIHSISAYIVHHTP